MWPSFAIPIQHVGGKWRRRAEATNILHPERRFKDHERASCCSDSNGMLHMYVTGKS